MQASEWARKHSSLSWFDFLWCKVLKGFRGENYESLNSADMDYFLMLCEYLDIEEFLDGVQNKEFEREQEARIAQSKAKRRR